MSAPTTPQVPRGRSFLNDSMEAAAARRRIVTRAPWSDPAAHVDAELAAEAETAAGSRGRAVNARGANTPAAQKARADWAAEVRRQGLGQHAIPTPTPRSTT
jgi:hypothetical protein